eukprot:TRINITY_DN21440_c0_g1_i1.p1 TRINITY_DN21440_c0_g1~~TRINITY_DN21440_c0_g1_i1.p1  ORF type:complete len:566 (+),score=70.16 TRINITY_DN21440_c0_g1_i1:100-1698(+)
MVVGSPPSQKFDDSSVDQEVWEHGTKMLADTVSVDDFREMVALRRQLHEIPELAFNEVKTAAVVREELKKIAGITVIEDSVGGTGVVALLRGTAAEGGKTVLFRADMDALPIQEVPSGSSEMQRVKRLKLSNGSCCGLCGSKVSQESLSPQSSPKNALLSRSWTKLTVSKIDGASHACGHDGHVAMLVAAAKVLATRRQKLRGCIVFLFQPAEERHPVGNPMGGAIRMIRDANAGEQLARVLGLPAKPALDRSSWTEEQLHHKDGFDKAMDGRLLDGVDEVYGAHLWNYGCAGTIGCGGGSVTANSDSLVISITGTGGHASAPQGTVDPVVVAAQFIMAAQGIVSRNTSPTESCVVTFGKIDGGVAPNVIAKSVKLMGTVRTYTQSVKRMVRRRLDEIAFGIAASHGPMCSINVSFLDGYPACINDSTCADAVLTAGKQLLGERLVGPVVPNMAGEDFSFILDRKPGAFFFVGSNPNTRFVLNPSLPVDEEDYEHGSRQTLAHHTPEFDIHEGALWCGAAVWVQLGLHCLRP